MLVNLKLRPIRAAWIIEPNNSEQLFWAIRHSCLLVAGRRFPILVPNDESYSAFRPNLDCLITLTDSNDAIEFLSREMYDSRFLEPKFFVEPPPEAPPDIDKFRTTYSLIRSNLQPEYLHWVFEESDEFYLLWTALYGNFEPKDEWGQDQVISIEEIITLRKKFIDKNATFLNDSNFPIWDVSLYRYIDGFALSDLNQLSPDTEIIYVFENFGFEDCLRVWNLQATGYVVVPYHVNESPRLARTHEVAQSLYTTPKGGFRPSIVLSSPALQARLPEWMPQDCIIGIAEMVSECDDLPMYRYSRQTLANIKRNPKNEQISFQIPFDRDFFVPDEGWRDEIAVEQMLVIEPDSGFDDSLDQTLCYPPLDLKAYSHIEAPISPGWRSDLIKGEKCGLSLQISEEVQFVEIPVLDKLKCVFDVFESAGYEASISDAGARSMRMIKRLGGLTECRLFRDKIVLEALNSFKSARTRTEHELENELCMLLAPKKDEIKRPDEFKGRLQRVKSIIQELIGLGILQIGKWLRCSECFIPSWFMLSELDDQIRCRLCGEKFQFFGQHNGINLRRSELFNPNDEQGGGIPVALTLLQFLEMQPNWQRSFFWTGIEVKDPAQPGYQLEIDFLLINMDVNGKVNLVLGESKGHKPILPKDLSDLLAVKEVLKKHFNVPIYLCFGSIAPVTTEFLSALEERSRLDAELILIQGKDLVDPNIRSKLPVNNLFQTNADVLSSYTIAHLRKVRQEFLVEIARVIDQKK